MKLRRLGKEGIEVSQLGLGCMSMTDYYGTPDDAESLATLEAAFSAGINFFDTADQYGDGKNEELLARFVQGKRDRVVLATKFGFTADPSSPTGRGIDASPRHVQEACEASLRRLQVDVIDLYYLHRVDLKVPIEDTVGAMSKLVAQGKVRQLGLSEVSPETLRRAHAVHPIAALQSEYSLWSRDPEVAVLQACRELGVGFVAFSPLGRGMLTGTVTRPEQLEPVDQRLLHPRFQGEAFQQNLKLVQRVKLMADEKGCSPAQLALAWVLARGNDVVPIPGTKRRKHLEDDLGALAVRLDDEDLQELDAIFPADAAVGTRYPAGMMEWVNR
jgi:aryl-alcohol dehydrogenase-like predicted oxidoreductase